MSINRFQRHVVYNFKEGDSVLCFEPDPTKARVLYEARILERDVGRNSQGRLQPEYKIHFQGWSRTWDRNVTERLLLPDSSSNRKLMRKLHEIAQKYRKNRRRKHLIILDILRHKGIERLESPIGSEAEDQEESEAEEEEEEEEEEEAQPEIRRGKRHFEEEAEEEVFKPSHKKKKKKKRVTPPTSPSSATRSSVKSFSSRSLRGGVESGAPTTTSNAHRRVFAHCRVGESSGRLHRDIAMPVPARGRGQRGRPVGRPRKSAPPVVQPPSYSRGFEEVDARLRGVGDSLPGINDDDLRESTSTSSSFNTGFDYDLDDDDNTIVLDDDDDDDESSNGDVYGSRHHHRVLNDEEEEEEEEDLISPDDGCLPPSSMPVPSISMPLALAHALTDAETKIQLGDELIRLPCEPKISVLAILEEYVQHFTYNLLSNPKWTRTENYRNLNSSGYGSGSEVSHLSCSQGGAVQVDRGKPGGCLPKVPPASSVNLCKEVVDGIRIMFDNYLGPILLYKPEVSQFKKLDFYYKPVLPKKVLFPGPVIMPSRLRSQSRVSGLTEVSFDAGAEGSGDAAAAATTPSASACDVSSGASGISGGVSGSASGGCGDGSVSETGSHCRVNVKGEAVEEEEEDSVLSTISSSVPPTTKLEPSEEEDRGNNDVKFGRTEGREGEEEEEEGNSNSHRLSRGPRSDLEGSSNDGASTEGGSSSARIDHLGRAYLASSRDRLSDDLLDDIENWRLLSDETVQKFPNSPSLLYGAHHFLRLFVHLPKLLSLLTDINSVKMNAILFHVEGILDYIDDNADYFLAEDFANLAHVMEELNANAARNKLH